MVRYYAVEGVDVVHILYNNVSEKSPACVLILKLGQHRHRLLTQSHVTLLAGRVYTVLLFKGSNHGTLFLY